MTYQDLDEIRKVEKITGKSVTYEIVDRRPGDIACCYADPKYANELLGWKAELGLNEMIEDAWRWQSNNPNGYQS